MAAQGTKRHCPPITIPLLSLERPRDRAGRISENPCPFPQGGWLARWPPTRATGALRAGGGCLGPPLPPPLLLWPPAPLGPFHWIPQGSAQHSCTGAAWTLELSGAQAGTGHCTHGDQRGSQSYHFWSPLKVPRRGSRAQMPTSTELAPLGFPFHVERPPTRLLLRVCLSLGPRPSGRKSPGSRRATVRDCVRVEGP